MIFSVEYDVNSSNNRAVKLLYLNPLHNPLYVCRWNLVMNVDAGYAFLVSSVQANLLIYSMNLTVHLLLSRCRHLE